MTLLLGVLQFIFQPTSTDVPYSGFFNGLVINLRGSVLVHSLFNPVLWLLARSLSLFIPKNADIFESVLSRLAGTAG